MTGVGAMLAGDGPYSTGGGGGGGGGPLVVTVTTRSGATSYNVSGTSGTADLVDANQSGGTPPYTVTTFNISDISGKMSIGQPTGADALLFSGFTLNEIEFGQITYAVQDSVGATATARFPSSGNLSVKRTS